MIKGLRGIFFNIFLTFKILKKVIMCVKEILLEKTMRKLLFLVCILSLTLVGCGSVSATINIGGSTSVQPLFEDLKLDYESENSGVNITYDGQGSSASIQGVKEGAYSIGTASREITEDELGEGLTVKTIARDGIVLVVNASNPVGNKGLTKQQVYDIYTGRYTNWKQVGGDDEDILVISRDSASGTRGAFEDEIGFDTNDSNGLATGALEFASNAEVGTNVMQNKSAIGYVSLDSVTKGMTPVKLDGVEPTLENIKNGSYKLTRPYNVIYYKDQLSQPEIEFLEWIDINKDNYLEYHGLVRA